jgi:5-methylcytosine-specific restriction endonuclease McrA
MTPSPEEQLAFLSKLQRLFNEGDFTATYKYALLIALADLAVELGEVDRLRITHRQLAAKFVELYWQQCAPYSNGGSTPGLLSQNNGAQASVIGAILEFRTRNPAATVVAARSFDGYSALVQAVAATVAAQPVNYLQNLGGQLDPFLYERDRGCVVLKTGVTHCLRRFQPLVQQLARSHWVGHIKRNKLNQSILGGTDDLESFLFEIPRQALIVIGAKLKQLTNSRCFYCGGQVHDADVDHFIPFSMYPRDLMHNFVLAHPACNRSKSDTLAAKPHLERWLGYITRNTDALQEIAHAAGRMADQGSSLAVARWSYSNAASGGAMAWVSARRYVPVDQEYARVLA